MTYTGEWVCDECGHRSMDEHAACDCEDTCTEHVKTIDRLRTQLRANRLSPEDIEVLVHARRV